MEFMGKRNRLLRPITNIGNIVAEPEISDKEDAEGHCTNNGATDLHPYVKPA
jgi:hypothetical protein